MRIGLIARRFDPAGGGTERDLIVTSRILADAGHDVGVFAAQIRGEFGGLGGMRAPSPGVGRTLQLLGFAARAADSAPGAGADLVLSFARVLNAEVCDRAAARTQAM